ncbi:HlyD family type I secretion periplasmic adaptor subunit [Sulfuricurvum sp.]|uniref:HlyD family type I secretion periplasmic adaptor subunit n=1 Tax=Sulfuricurvum sp. TaxID=2025608 RepID=UPI002E32E227|nr:HlyD family type I secretion periplasmic adaptor subunit [Sulfuricurvum sp.]HEX5329072.1 HlyD family type I secretion periplasmic adaptor subunit [Sulfuricurvum sp.]
MTKMTLEKRWNYYITVIPIGLFLLTALIWAAFSEIDEVVRGEGKVIPSGQTKVLQHMEGGIVAEILVNEGDEVAMNQPIYRLEQASFTAESNEKDLEKVALQAKQHRLESLTYDKPLVFSAGFSEKYPQIVSNEMQIYYSEKLNNSDRLNSALQKAEQKKYEIQDLEAKLRDLSSELDVETQNTAIAEQLMKSGAGSKKEYLAEMSKKQNLITELNGVKNQIPIAKGKASEALYEVSSIKSEIKSKALNELQDIRLKLSQTFQQSEASVDRTKRLLITSPVKGVVNKLYYFTIGGAIKPGDKVAEITPLESGFMIDANIRALDRGRIWIGQKVSIEITAYDYAKYGKIEGQLVSISPDSYTNQKGEILYAVKVKAYKDNLGKNLPIMPGMEAVVNIVTGKRTVLSYLFLPIKRMGKNSMLEP